MATWRAGTARTIITPPVGVELSGYGFGPSVGILDDLQAQALVLESDTATVAIVTADLIGFGAELVASVRQRIQASLGIPDSHVLLSASHTHSGPAAEPMRQWGAVDENYVRLLADHLVGLVHVAWHNRQDARIGIGMGRVDNVSENRRRPDGPRDVAVPVVRVDNAQGEPMAVLFSMGCHPVSLHSYRNLISPDYPGYARQVLADVLGKDVVSMFVLGTAGDINPAGYVARQTTPRRSRQIGAIVGCEVARVALDPANMQDTTLRIERAQIELPVEPLPARSALIETRDRYAAQAEQLRAENQPFREIAVAEIHRDWASDALQALDSGNVLHSLPFEVWAMRLGNVAAVALPAETFTDTGLAIRAASPAALTMTISNSNGCIGYLPTAEAYETEDYTNPQGLAPKVYGIYALSPGAEPLVRRTAIDLVQSLF
jgi:neutral ceramidase